MQCPKCYGEMDTVSEVGVESLQIECCRQCHGLYFDRLVQADVDQLAGYCDLDTGDASGASEYDDMVYVECPKCNRIMDQRLDDAQVRIRFESCPACHAAFLDAGELRQYASIEHRDTFRALLPEE